LREKDLMGLEQVLAAVEGAMAEAGGGDDF
jgi:hypothetical protein